MSEQVLALSLRPRSLKEMIGQSTLVAALTKQMLTRVPGSIAFVGIPGGGKTTLARIVALGVQCTHQPEGKWGTFCQICWDDQNKFNIHEINAAETGGVEDTGGLVNLSRLRPTYGKKRVFIIDEGQSLTSNSQNLLLKPIEHPPTSTLWMFCTTNPGKLLTALRTRFITYTVAPLGFKSREVLIARAAKAIKFTATTGPFEEEINKAQISSPRMILTAFEKFASGMGAQEAVQGSETTADTLRICRALLAGDWPTMRTELGKATAEDTRLIQGACTGYLRGALMKENDIKRRYQLSKAMLDLLGVAPPEDAPRWVWLQAMICKVMLDLKR